MKLGLFLVALVAVATAVEARATAGDALAARKLQMNKNAHIRSVLQKLLKERDFGMDDFNDFFDEDDFWKMFGGESSGTTEYPSWFDNWHSGSTMEPNGEHSGFTDYPGWFDWFHGWNSGFTDGPSGYPIEKSYDGPSGDHNGAWDAYEFLEVSCNCINANPPITPGHNERRSGPDDGRSGPDDGEEFWGETCKHVAKVRNAAEASVLQNIIEQHASVDYEFGQLLTCVTHAAMVYFELPDHCYSGEKRSAGDPDLGECKALVDEHVPIMDKFYDSLKDVNNEMTRRDIKDMLRQLIKKKK